MDTIIGEHSISFEELKNLVKSKSIDFGFVVSANFVSFVMLDSSSVSFALNFDNDKKIEAYFNKEVSNPIIMLLSSDSPTSLIFVNVEFFCFEGKG